MAFSVTKFNEIRNFQRILLEGHCLVTYKALIIYFRTNVLKIGIEDCAH